MFVFTQETAPCEPKYLARCDAVPSLLPHTRGKTRPHLSNSVDTSNHQHKSSTQMQFQLP